MKPGPDHVLECPHCKTPVVIFTLASGNTSDARIWTDGKIIAPMLPSLPAVTRCKKCALFFWIHEARKIGEIPLWGAYRENIPASWKDAGRVGELSELEYLDALASGAAKNRDQELYLRMEAWRAGNDPQRFCEKEEPFIRSDVSNKNLLQLGTMLDEKKVNERIIKAEVMRQMGRFEESIRLLEFDFSEEYRLASSLIRECAIKRNPGLKEIKSSGL